MPQAKRKGNASAHRTVWAVLEIVVILKEFCSPYRDDGLLFLYMCTLIVILIGCIRYWRRYLAYGRKKKS